MLSMTTKNINEKPQLASNASDAIVGRATLRQTLLSKGQKTVEPALEASNVGALDAPNVHARSSPKHQGIKRFDTPTICALLCYTHWTRA